MTATEGELGKVDVSEKAVRIRRRIVWPTVLALLIGSAGFSVAQAYYQELPVGSPLTAEWSEPDAVPALGEVLAPEPTVSPAANTPSIEVILPPPPPPPPPAASSGRKSGSASSRVAQAAAAGVSTTDQWCDGKYGATASASSLSGLLAAANAERARFGLAALSWNDSLATTAQTWSADMAARSDPGNPLAVLAHGMTPSPGGQNVAAYWSSPAAGSGTAIAVAHSNWMTSTGHCKNILRASFTSMGAGIAVSPDGAAWFTTVNFQ